MIDTKAADWAETKFAQFLRPATLFAPSNFANYYGQRNLQRNGRQDPKPKAVDATGKKMVRYNFSSQNRAVTLKDYLVLIDKMPGTFGIPFRNNVSERQNKIDIAILGLDSTGKLTNTSTNTLKENIASWLADYRMINDYVLTRDGKVFDLGFEIDIFIDKAFAKGEVIAGVISSVQKYFKVQDWDMGDNVYLSQLVENINNVDGVLNVIDFKIFNKAGTPYSSNVTVQDIVDNETLQINLTEDFALFAEYDSMFQIRFPQQDIKVRVKE